MLNSSIDFTLIKNTQDSNGTDVSYILEGDFSNGAGLVVNISISGAASQIPFANSTVALAPYSMKYSFQISNWPFYSLLNQLSVVLQATPAQTQDNPPAPATSNCNSPYVSSDVTGNLIYFVLRVGGVQMYGQMVPIILVDGRAKASNATFRDTTQEVQLNLPHFWDSIVVDPNYSILLEDFLPCGNQDGAKDKLSPKVLAGVVVGVVGGTVLIAALIAIVGPKISLWNTMRKATNVDENEPDVPMTPIRESVSVSVSNVSAKIKDKFANRYLNK